LERQLLAAGSEFFKAWGNTGDYEADRMVGLCLDEGVNLFDTANAYSRGLSEEILGRALKGLREKVLISTKATFPMSDDPNDLGSSRWHLLRACEASLRRLNTDHIDIYHMHGFDGVTPVEETLRALERPGAKRQGPVHCLLQFFGLAFNEVPFRQRAVWMGPLCGSSGILFLLTRNLNGS